MPSTLLGGPIELPAAQPPPLPPSHKFLHWWDNPRLIEVVNNICLELIAECTQLKGILRRRKQQNLGPGLKNSTAMKQTLRKMFSKFRKHDMEKMRPPQQPVVLPFGLKHREPRRLQYCKSFMREEQGLGTNLLRKAAVMNRARLQVDTAN